MNCEDISAEAVPAKEAEGKWQPIETAPKDGTVIDLFGRRSGMKPRRWPSAVWCEDHFGGEPTGYFSWHHYGWDNYGRYEYTHWMPLPAPPVQS